MTDLTSLLVRSLSSCELIKKQRHTRGRSEYEILEGPYYKMSLISIFPLRNIFPRDDRRRDLKLGPSRLPKTYSILTIKWWIVCLAKKWGEQSVFLNIQHSFTDYFSLFFCCFFRSMTWLSHFWAINNRLQWRKTYCQSKRKKRVMMKIICSETN